MFHYVVEYGHQIKNVSIRDWEYYIFDPHLTMILNLVSLFSDAHVNITLIQITDNRDDIENNCPYRY